VKELEMRVDNDSIVENCKPIIYQQHAMEITAMKATRQDWEI